MCTTLRAGGRGRGAGGAWPSPLGVLGDGRRTQPGWLPPALAQMSIEHAVCCVCVLLLSCRGRIHTARSLAASLSSFVVSTALLLRDQVG